MATVCYYIFLGIQSKGVLHPDEHFQVFPALLAKANLLSTNALSWEFHEEMRSYLLPAFFWISSFIPYHLGAEEPFLVLALSRVLIGLFSVFCTFYFLKNYFQDTQWFKLSFVCTLGCWFVPLLHVRTSAENMSYNLFLIGASFLLSFKEREKFFKIIFCFLFLYLSFHARPQMALFIFGLLCWQIKEFITCNENGQCFSSFLRFFFFSLVGTGLGLGLALSVDFWGYGHFVVTPWNYFYQNIILKKADGFGTSPWWYYFYLTFIKSYFFLYPLLFSTVCLYFYKRPKSFLTFILIPFLVVHFLISHKELRFLNAFYFFLPVMFIDLWKSKDIIFPKFFGPNKIQFILNSLFLIFIFFVPASKDQDLYRALDKNLRKFDRIYVSSPNFKLEMSFLNRKKIQVFNKEADLKDYFYLTTSYLELVAVPQKCQKFYSSYSLNVLNLLPEKIRNRSSVFALWFCP